MFNFLRNLCNPTDQVIDFLIEECGVSQYREGMHKVDPMIIDREGQRKWSEVLQAQRRLYKKPDLKALPFTRTREG